MNHLAHLLLAERSNGLLVGGFLGDFVKGRLKGDRPTAIEQGIKLHRYIDHHQYKHYLDPRRGIYESITFETKHN